MIYTSKVLNRSILHLSVDEGLEEYKPGFKKNYFASSQRRCGSSALVRCEVPVPWSKHLIRSEIDSHLNLMFKDAPDIRIYGDATG